MKTGRKKTVHWRSMVLACGFVLALVVIGAKAVHLQVVRGPWLSEQAAGQYESAQRLQGKRGTIYDRNCKEMAISIEVTSVAATPRKIDRPRETARVLAGKLDLKAKELDNRLSTQKPFVWLRRHITPRQAAEIKSLELDGMVFVPEFSRFYPHKTLAAQVLGFSGIDGRGLEGIEFKYQNLLQGHESRFNTVKDALGRHIQIDLTDPAAVVQNRSRHLVLTIDSTVQYVCEKTLAETVDRFQARSGMVVAMNPNTGAILALAHAPVFNPNTYQQYDREKWRNRAVTDPFEPGSTMKIFLAAAALESGLCTPRSIFYCENGSYRIGRHVVHDSGSHAYGWLSLQKIVKFSSNIGAVKLAERIGPELLYETLGRFGFGSRTRIDCPGETTGSLAHFRDWSRMDFSAISFGQGVSVSAIQLATAMSAVANGGILMKPYVVQAVMDKNGQLVKSVVPQQVRRVVSVDTSRVLRRILHTVTTAGGTGTRAALEAFSVGGKTGTAQKVSGSGTYARGKYVSSFVGFAPAENPAVVVLVVVDEPKTAHYGGVVAAPAFRRIAGEILQYLAVPASTGENRWMVSGKKEVRG